MLLGILSTVYSLHVESTWALTEKMDEM